MALLLFNPDTEEDEDDLYLNDDLDRRRVEEDEDELPIDHRFYDDDEDDFEEDISW